MTLHVEWISESRKAERPADPAYPDGMPVDLSAGREPTCHRALPYPALCVGRWLVTCTDCSIRVLVTAAGRKDDPRSVIVACKKSGEALAA